MSNETITVHPFEKTLGPGPYKFLGSFSIVKPSEKCPTGNYAEVNARVAAVGKFVRGAGTCAHCNMSIMNVFMVEIGNGEVYGVGCDCIEKVGLPAKEMTKVQREQREREKAQRKVRKANKIEKAREKLEELMESKGEEMKKLPHPSISGLSLFDYAVYLIENNCSALYALPNIRSSLGYADFIDRARSGKLSF
jgi:hypothetical protein